MLPLRGTYFTLVSPHAPEVCADRLRVLTAGEAGLSWLRELLSEKPLQGTVSSEIVRLRKRNGYANVFQPEFNATLEPYGSGTRFDCRVGVPVFPRLLLTLMVPIFSLTGICLTFGALANLLRGEVIEESFRGGVFLLPFMIVFVLGGRYAARGEGEFLEHFVTQQLDARREGGV